MIAAPQLQKGSFCPPAFSFALNVWEVHALSLSASLWLHSSDSEGHFDTPEAATPVRAPPTFPGELENNNAEPDKTGEATAEQITVRERKDAEEEARRAVCPRRKHTAVTPRGSRSFSLSLQIVKRSEDLSLHMYTAHIVPTVYLCEVAMETRVF